MKPDLQHLAAGMRAEALALREKAEQLNADATALEDLLPRTTHEVKWIDARSMALGDAAAMLGDLIGGDEPRMYCNLEDYVRAGLQGVRSRVLLARGHGWLIPQTFITPGRVVSG